VERGTTGITMDNTWLSCKSDSTARDASSSVDLLLLKDWHIYQEWSNVEYGDREVPGVSAGPGPIYTLGLKDRSPGSSVVTQKTFIPKARYQAIDYHVHESAMTAGEVADWLKTMDDIGIETSIVLTGRAVSESVVLIDLLPETSPGRFFLTADLRNLKETNLIIKSEL
jgi:uncharacterized protein